MNAKDLKGNWGTLLLPVNADDSISYGRLEDEIDHLIAAGLDGIYSNGTAGEFHNQSEQDFDRVQALMAEKCRKAGMPFQIGASHPSPLLSLERIKRTVTLGPAAFQIILPDWVAAGEEEQDRFLEKMADAARGIPLVLYNPPHAKTLLTPRDLLRISRANPRVIGIKTGAGDAGWYQEMRSYAPALSVFVPGHLLATGMQEGVAAGAYSNMACLSPKGSQAWWQSMQTDLPAALRVQERILKFFDQCIVPYKRAGFSNPALDKFLAAVGGWGSVGTRLRWPYKWIDEQEAVAAGTVARRLLPEFF